MIRTLKQMEGMVLALKKKYRVAVAWAQDTNSIVALNKAVKKGLIDAVLIGNTAEIRKTCKILSVDENNFTLVESGNEILASSEAVRLVKTGEADIVMKGLVGTDKFLKAVMDKELSLIHIS